MSTPTVTVTATLNDPSGSALQGNAFIRFRLRNFAGFIPQVTGYSVPCETQIDAFPNSSGLISQAIVPNADISPSTTFYTVEYWNNGRITSSGNYIINGATNLNTAAQLNAPPVPPGFQLVLQNNGQDNSSQSTLNLENTDGTVTITDEGGGTINLSASGGGGGISKKWPGNWSGWNMNGNPAGTILGQTGTDFVNFNLSETQIAPTATQGYSVSVNLVGNNNCSGYDDDIKNITVGILQDWFVKAALVGTASSRYWLGFWDGAEGPTTGLATNTPSANLVGFRYNSATDASIVAVCQTSSSNQTVVATGVAPPTAASPAVFEIVPSGSAINFYINETLVASITTNIPANTVAMRSILVADPVGNDSGSNYALQLWYLWMLFAN